MKNFLVGLCGSIVVVLLYMIGVFIGMRMMRTKVRAGEKTDFCGAYMDAIQDSMAKGTAKSK